MDVRERYLLCIHSHLSVLTSDVVDTAVENAQDSWWTELREEVRTHCRSLSCTHIVGYRETMIVHSGLLLSGISPHLLFAPTCVIRVLIGTSDCRSVPADGVWDCMCRGRGSCLSCEATHAQFKFRLFFHFTVPSVRRSVCCFLFSCMFLELESSELACQSAHVPFRKKAQVCCLCIYIYMCVCFVSVCMLNTFVVYVCLRVS